MTPEAVESLFDEANGDLAMGDLEAAAEKYRRCTELAPAFFDAWHALGMVLMKLGRFPEAVEVGLHTITLGPDDQMAWTSLSIFHQRNGQIPEAEAAAAKARILGWGGKVSKMEN